MIKRLAAVCGLVIFAHAAAYGQGGGMEGPPPQEGPPPAQQNTPPPVQQNTPPRQGPAQSAERCGSVAYTADGAFGAAYGMEDCQEAERLAIDECVRESTDKPDCSRGAVTRRDSWFYIQFCRRGDEWTTHVTTQKTFAGVNQDGAEWARKSKYGAEYCRLVPNGLIHSGGLHTKM